MKRNNNLKILAIVNALLFLGVIAVNYMANALPINGYNTGELSDDLPNLFVPAGLTFAIWGLIYALLAMFVLYQFHALKKRNGRFIGDIGIWFAVSSIANIGWIFAWHYKQIALSLVFMLIILSSLILIVLRLRPNRKYSTGLEKVAVYHSFSVYLGWISVATIANVTAVLVTINWNGFGIGHEFWTVLVIGAAIMLAWLSLARFGDIPYALVIDWALVGIIMKRYQTGGLEYMWILIIATIGVVFISSLSLYKFVRR
ncbi:MAG: tryptophan-rich sensory protein [Peptostreptococcaceae bacterium]|nr:tryptophan-rich sensory protein [Peptostreptococcaceae bacterium]